MFPPLYFIIFYFIYGFNNNILGIIQQWLKFLYCYIFIYVKGMFVNIDSKVKNGSEEIEIVDDVEKGFSTLK